MNKNKFIKKFALLFSILTLGILTTTNVLAQGAEYRHVEITSLSEAQRGAIQQGVPTDVQANEKITYVYQKKDSTPANQLPNTGTHTLLPAALTGIVAILAAATLVKSQRARQLLLLGIISGAAVVTGTSVFAENSAAFNGAVNAQQAQQADMTKPLEQLAEYVYVGYLRESILLETTAVETTVEPTTETTSVASTYKVTVQYVDVDTKKVLKEEVLSEQLAEGATYDATAKQVEKLEVDGVTYYFDNAASALSGTQGNTDTQITLYYQKEVTVRYVYNIYLEKNIFNEKLYKDGVELTSVQSPDSEYDLIYRVETLVIKGKKGTEIAEQYPQDLLKSISVKSILGDFDSYWDFQQAQFENGIIIKDGNSGISESSIKKVFPLNKTLTEDDLNAAVLEDTKAANVDFDPNKDGLRVFFAPDVDDLASEPFEAMILEQDKTLEKTIHYEVVVFVW